MEIMVNGNPKEVSTSVAVGGVVDEHSPSRQGVAVAVNETVLTRSLWDSTPLTEGDRIEIVTAMQGG
ncbi:sulfur carrier protein ThiS [Streptomyces sp. NPDC048636]|uniref:sulfur carrier protein ThiS n=1 Tax=Streptomyces sp. NPDC048636 TaxID=3155762 RepID=UPI0034201B94